MQIIKTPNLELRWLKPDKTIKAPLIVYAEEYSSFGGFFIKPEKCEYLFEGSYISADNGIIAITQEGDEANTIAHEYRHLWQYTNGWDLNSIGWNNPVDYKQGIIEYFIKSSSEMDALLWSQAKAPCDWPEQWLVWIKEYATCST